MGLGLFCLSEPWRITSGELKSCNIAFGNQRELMR